MRQGKAGGKILDAKTANSSRFLWIVVKSYFGNVFSSKCIPRKGLKITSQHQVNTVKFILRWSCRLEKRVRFHMGWTMVTSNCLQLLSFSKIPNAFPIQQENGEHTGFLRWNNFRTKDDCLRVRHRSQPCSTGEKWGRERKAPPSQTFWSRRKNQINTASYKYLTGPWPEQQGPHLCSMLLATRVNPTNFCFPVPVPQHQGRPQVWPLPSHHRVACVLFICWALCKALTRNH